MASLTFQSFIFFCTQTRFSSDVIFIFQKCLDVWKDMYMSGRQACRGSPHGPIEKEMCHLKAEKNKSFWMFSEPDTISLFCLLMYMYFLLFYYPTLSLLCMFQSYNDNLFYGWTSSCFFCMTEHNSVFCNQKQGSAKNVYSNLSGNL